MPAEATVDFRFSNRNAVERIDSTRVLSFEQYEPAMEN